MTQQRETPPSGRLHTAWAWLLDEPAGQAVALALVVAVSVASQKLAHDGPGESLFWWVVLLGLPSLLTLLAFLLLARIVWGPGRSTLLAGAVGYAAFGFLLAAVFLLAADPVGDPGSVWRGGSFLLGILIWPTVALELLGPQLGWWAGPE